MRWRNRVGRPCPSGAAGLGNLPGRLGWSAAVGQSSHGRDQALSTAVDVEDVDPLMGKASPQEPTPEPRREQRRQAAAVADTTLAYSRGASRDGWMRVVEPVLSEHVVIPRPRPVSRCRCGHLARPRPPTEWCRTRARVSSFGGDQLGPLPGGIRALRPARTTHVDAYLVASRFEQIVLGEQLAQKENVTSGWLRPGMGVRTKIPDVEDVEAQRLRTICLTERLKFRREAGKEFHVLPGDRIDGSCPRSLSRSALSGSSSPNGLTWASSTSRLRRSTPRTR